MPYVFVGKRNFYIGKTLWEILGNLKNFGIGRILVRSKFERYPEVSYVKILRVEPLMDEVGGLTKCFKVYYQSFSPGKQIWASVGREGI